jgi:hypothetical protein
MKRFLATAVLWGLAAVALWWGDALPLVHASTVQGTAVTISGLDDLNATVDSQARKGSGKIIALIFGVGGLGTMAAGYHMTGLGGVGAGLGVGFLPGIMSSGFDAAPAATSAFGAQIPLVSHWWTPLTAGLYPGLLALRFLQDPVVLVAVALALLLVRCARTQTPRVGLAR